MAGTRWSTVAARLGALLLVGAGSLWVWAAVERWWPECRLGRYESYACQALQDDRYEYVLPSEPWVPVGTAASMWGVGALALALGLALLVPMLAVEPVHRALAPAFVILALLLVPIGGGTFLSGRTGQPVGLPLLGVTAGTWGLLMPLALTGLVLYIGANGATPRGWWYAASLAGSLILASPVVEYFVMMMSYGSHDTPPWSGALSGASLVAGGLAAWLLSRKSSGERHREGRVPGGARQLHLPTVGLGDRRDDAQP